MKFKYGHDIKYNITYHKRRRKIFLKNLCLKYNINWQFVKFLLVGGLNTLWGYIVFSLCIFCSLHYAAATLIATVLGVLFNFKTTGCIVFKNNNNRLLLRFISVYVFVYFLTVLCLKIFTLIGMSNYYLNYAIILLPNAILSFFLMKKFVFN